MFCGDTEVAGDDALRELISQIYKHCDPENKDLVPVSLLLDLVRSCMIDNDFELAELHLHLDPANINPSVSLSFFYAAMTQWVDKIGTRNCNYNTAPINNNPSYENHTNIEAEREREREKEREREREKEREEQLVAKAKHDAAMEFEIKNALTELETMREQFAASQEKNRVLEADLRKVRKFLQAEKNVHDETRKKLAEISDAYEQANKMLKTKQKLEATIDEQKKDFEVLENDYSRLEAQKATLESKLTKLTKNQARKLKEEVYRFEQELIDKDMKISQLSQAVDEMQTQLNIQFDLVQFYTNENNMLKQNVKYFEEQEEYLSIISKNSQLESYQSLLSLFPFDDPTASFDDSDYPLANLIRKLFSTEGKPLSCVKSSPALSQIFLSAQNLKRHNSSITFQEFKKVSKLVAVPEESSSKKSLRDELIEATLMLDKDTWTGCTSSQECFRNTCDKLQDIIESQNEEIWELKNKLAKCEPEPVKEIKEKGSNTDRTEVRNSLAQTEKEVVKAEVKSSENDLILLEVKDSVMRMQNDYRATVEKLLSACCSLEKVTAVTNSPSAALNEHEAKLQKGMGNLQKTIDSLISKLPEPLKQNTFAKQELRIEKLMDKVEQLENEISCERDVQSALRLRCKEQESALQEFKDYKLKTDNTLQSNKDMLEKHALENRKLAEMFTEDIAVLEHEKKLLLEEVVELKDKLHKLEEIKQELQAKNEKLRKDLEIMREELKTEKSIAASLREDNQRLQLQENHFEEDISDEMRQLCYNEVPLFKTQALDLRKPNHVAILTLEKSLKDRVNDVGQLETRLKVKDVWSFLTVSSSELARATSSIMVRLRPQFRDDYDYNSLTKLLQEIGHGDSAREVLDVAMIKLNNTIKLVMILLETLADKLVNLQNTTSDDDNESPSSSNQNEKVRKRKKHFAIQ